MEIFTVFIVFGAIIAAGYYLRKKKASPITGPGSANPKIDPKGK